MRKLAVIMTLLLAFGQASTAFANSRDLCVLTFLSPSSREGQRYAKVVNDVFADTDARLIQAAEPRDLFKCLDSHAREIILVLHSAPALRDDEATFVWYRKLSSPERENYLKQRKSYIEQRLPELRSQIRRENAGRMRKGSEAQLGSDAEHTQHIFRSVLGTTDDLLTDKTRDIYVKKPFLPVTWMLFRDELARRQQENGSLDLKKIRIMSCQPDKVLARYPELADLRADFNIEIEMASPNPWLSALKRHKVVSLDPEWLKKSLFNDDP